MAQDPPLHILDYVVAVIVLAVPMAIGIVFAYKDAKKMTRLEYLLGGQRMSILPVTLSTFVTFTSAISLIGFPSEIYTYGTGFFYVYVGFTLTYLICYNTLVPLMYPLKVTSIYEYLHLRFHSQLVRMVSTVIGCLQITSYMAIALLSPALAMQAAGGMPMWISILVVGAVGTIYTVIGGIKSVIWTDVFQTLIVFIGTLTIIVKGSVAVGGFDKAWTIAAEGGRIRFGEFTPDPRIRHTVWSGVLGGLCMWMTHSYGQSTLQRIRSLKTMRDAKISYLLNIPVLTFYNVSLITTGVVTFAYFSYTRCDPYKADLISNRNQIVPYFVYHALTDLPGMAGLYMSTLFCGSLSTLSSGINALAAITVQDLLERPLKNASERTATIVTKITAAFYGVTICLLSYGAQFLDGPVNQISNTVQSAFGTPILGMFLIGCAIPWGTKYGALAGGITALAFNLWINFGNRMHGRKPFVLPAAKTDNCLNFSSTTVDLFKDSLMDHDIIMNSVVFRNASLQNNNKSDVNGFFLYDVSYEWFAVYGLTVCLLTGILVSLCTRSDNWRKSQNNFHLVFPICRRLWSLEKPRNSDELSSLTEKPEAKDIDSEVAEPSFF